MKKGFDCGHAHDLGTCEMSLWQWILSWFSAPPQEPEPHARYQTGDLVWAFQFPPVSDDPLQPLEESVILRQFRVCGLSSGASGKRRPHCYILEARGSRIQAHESNLFETAADAVNSLPMEYWKP